MSNHRRVTARENVRLNPLDLRRANVRRDGTSHHFGSRYTKLLILKKITFKNEGGAA
jgi:hypothetical protein